MKYIVSINSTYIGIYHPIMSGELAVDYLHQFISRHFVQSCIKQNIKTARFVEVWMGVYILQTNQGRCTSKNSTHDQVTELELKFGSKPADSVLLSKWREMKAAANEWAPLVRNN